MVTEVAHNRAEKKVLGRGCLKLILALAELLPSLFCKLQIRDEVVGKPDVCDREAVA